MKNNCDHWGKIDDHEENNMVSCNWRSHMKPNPLPIKIPDYPVSFNSRIKAEKIYENVSIDPVTVHCVQLEKHNREMVRLLETAKIQMETGKTGFVGEGDVPIIMFSAPTIPEPKATNDPNSAEWRFLRDGASSFLFRSRSPYPCLTEQTAWKLLRRSIAAILAVTGYESTTPNVLDTLTDIADDFLVRMTRLLKCNSTRVQLHRTAPFRGTVEQVFQELGIGSIQEIKDFYKWRVLGRRDGILEKTRSLHEEYDGLRNSGIINKGVVDDVLSPAENDSIPELKFPEMEEGQETPLQMETSLQLEDGLQVLQSFEQAQSRSDLENAFF